jgi:hypothetical protein
MFYPPFPAESPFGRPESVNITSHGQGTCLPENPTDVAPIDHAKWRHDGTFISVDVESQENLVYNFLHDVLLMACKLRMQQPRVNLGPFRIFHPSFLHFRKVMIIRIRKCNFKSFLSQSFYNEDSVGQVRTRLRVKWSQILETFTSFGKHRIKIGPGYGGVQKYNALFARSSRGRFSQHLRGFADVTRIRCESGAYVCHANVTRKMCVRCASCSPRIMPLNMSFNGYSMQCFYNIVETDSLLRKLWSGLRLWKTPIFIKLLCCL